MKQFLLPLCLFAGLMLSAQNRRLHVLPGASGTGDGSSWQHAFTDLQAALAESQAGDSLWIAQGVYYPDAGDRTRSFRVKSGVRVFGGFSGVETEFSGRDWELHPVTLSGAIGSILSGDNSLHIAYLESPDSNTVLDGLRFTKGVEDADTTDPGGAALYIWAKDTLGTPVSAARIRNCRFEDNASVSYGGAIAIASYGADHTRFERCTFSLNDARFGGAAGISAVEIHTEFTDCRFVSNEALEGGGAASLAATQSGVRFQRCIFEKNRTKNSGGGAVSHVGAGLPGKGVVFRDCQFLENVCEINSYPEGGALYMGSWSGSDTLLIDNCLFRKNTGEKAGALYIDQSGTAGSRYCIRDCRFEENESANVAAIRTGCSGGCSDKFIRSFDVSGSVFLKNKGMALSIEGSASDTLPSVVSIDSCLFRENRNAAVFNLNIEGNSMLHIEATEFRANRNGEVLVTLAKQNTLTNCIIDDNRDAYWLMSWEEGVMDLRNCLFRKNQSQDFLFGVNFGTLNAVNCHFDANTPGDDYPFPFFSAEASITNSVFTGNTGTPYVVPGYMHPHFQHCFFAAPLSNPPATLSLGAGNLIGGDPMFTDAAAGNFHLLPCSPLVGAGDSGAASGWASDLSGAARIQGGAVEIGIFENAPPQLATPPLATGSCPGKAAGSVFLQPANGCAPYTIGWASGTASGQDTTGLLPGDYVFQVTDARGSSASFPVSIPENPGPVLMPAVTPLDCGISLGGTVALNASGNGPFIFQWADGPVTPLRDGLAAGIYPVRATDAEGCVTEDTIVIGRQGRLKASLQIDRPSCAGAADGQLSVMPQNGLAPYTWSWDTGDTTAVIEHLGAGTYGLTLSDGLGCSIRWMIPLPEPDVDCIGDETSVFPNPFENYLYIRTGFEPDADTRWVLSDALGRAVRLVGPGGFGSRVELGDLPAGFYSWQLRQGGRLLNSGKLAKR